MVENETETKNELDLSKLSPSLIKYFNINTNTDIDTNTCNKKDSDWNPPETPGLNNSFRIIPEYYMKKNKQMIDIDYFDIIIDDIRNLRKLNDHQLNFIKTLNNDEKQTIFIELNKLFDTIHTLLS